MDYCRLQRGSDIAYIFYVRGLVLFNHMVLSRVHNTANYVLVIIENISNAEGSSSTNLRYWIKIHMSYEMVSVIFLKKKEEKQTKRLRSWRQKFPTLWKPFSLSFSIELKRSRKKWEKEKKNFSSLPGSSERDQDFNFELVDSASLVAWRTFGCWQEVWLTSG